MDVNKFRKKIVSLLSSKYFFYSLLTLVIFQGLWYAFSFQPSILDEQRHLGMIELYSNRINPFIVFQDQRFDWLGDITRDPSYLYYFVLSIPLRIVRFFTGSWQAQVIFLRLIHVAVFTVGIYVYDKFFRRIGIPKFISRSVLLFLVLTPSVAVLPGVVNYDSFVFLFSGLLLIQTAKIIDSKTLKTNDVLVFVALFIFGSLVKYTFLALAVPVALFLLFYIKRTMNLNFKRKLGSIRSVKPLLLATCVVGLGLLIERPIMNFVRYGDFTANCIELYGKDRCAVNYVQQRDITALDRKPEGFEPKSLYEYTFIDWAPNIILTQVRLNPWDIPSRVLHALYFIGFFSGIFVILIYLRELLRDKYYFFMMLSFMSVAGVLLIRNYLSYVELAEVVATSSRYLLPVQPLFMVVAAISLTRMLKKWKSIKILLLLGVLVIFLFGGGILTYNRTVPDELRWSSSNY